MSSKQDAFVHICERMRTLTNERPALAPNGETASISDLIRKIGVVLDHRQAA